MIMCEPSHSPQIKLNKASFKVNIRGSGFGSSPLRSDDVLVHASIFRSSDLFANRSHAAECTVIVNVV